MDLLILIVLMVIVVAIFRKFDSFIYFIAIVDIFLRITTMIKNSIDIPELYQLLNNYIPESIISIITKYATGIFSDILIWAYIICLILFEYYIIRTFFKKKK